MIKSLLLSILFLIIANYSTFSQKNIQWQEKGIFKNSHKFNDTSNYDHNKNLIEISISEWLLNRRGIAVERMLSPTISFKLLGFQEFEKSDFFFSYWKTMIINSLGIQVLYYPLGHKKFSYISGLSYKFGEVLTKDYKRVYDQFGFYYIQEYYRKNHFMFPEILNGFRLNLGQHICFSGYFGIGIIKINDSSRIDSRLSSQFGMGVKF